MVAFSLVGEDLVYGVHQTGLGGNRWSLGALVSRRSCHRGLYRWSIRDLAVHVNPLPQFQIQQSPDAIVMVAITGPMFPDQLLYRAGFEESALQTSGLEQQISDGIKLLSGQPPAPGRGKPKFRAVKNRMRQKVFHCLLQNLFACKDVELETLGNAGRTLNQHVIEKRNAALDGGRHAHVV